MPNKLPRFRDNHKICIICEGNEEYEYLDRLIALKVWSGQYDISLVNAGGNGKFRRDIRIVTRMAHMRLCLYFVIRKKSLMSSGWIDEINTKIE